MTAEFAVLLPVITLLVAALLVVASCAVAQMRCTDAARTGARGAALGEPDAAVAEMSRRVGGEVQVAVHRDQEWVRVEVVRTLGPALPVVGAVTVRAQAMAWVEP